LQHVQRRHQHEQVDDRTEHPHGNEGAFEQPQGTANFGFFVEEFHGWMRATFNG
jgi:hypothetical protein